MTSFPPSSDDDPLADLTDNDAMSDLSNTDAFDLEDMGSPEMDDDIGFAPDTVEDVEEPASETTDEAAPEPPEDMDMTEDDDPETDPADTPEMVDDAKEDDTPHRATLTTDPPPLETPSPERQDLPFDQLLASTETELNRRFDDVELVMMELLHLLATPSDPDRPERLSSLLHAELKRIEEVLAQACDQRIEQDNRLTMVEDLLRQTNERSVRQFRRQKGWVKAMQTSREDARGLLGDLSSRLDALAAQTPAPSEPDLTAVLDGQAALRAMLEALKLPDIDPVQAQLTELRAQLTALSDRDSPAPDLTPVQDDIAALNRRLSTLAEQHGPDIHAIRDRLDTGLSTLSEVLADLPREAQTLAPLIEGQTALLDKLETLKRTDIDPIQATLTDIQARLALFSEQAPPDPDLSPLRDEVGQGFDRLAALVGERNKRQDAERKGLTALRHGLEATVSRLDTLLCELETRQSPPTAAPEARHTTLAEPVAGPVAGPHPDLTALQNRVEAGVDRIIGAITTQGRVLDAERRALTPFFDGLDSFFARLEAATCQIEAQANAQPSFALDTRLKRIEAQLSRLETPAQDNSAEALRDLSMLLAEMMARQEQLIHRDQQASA
ncbi:hypothetical protein J4E08_22595 [Sagittula sp. NFXS13]|uniref:hypothetical protein n=1 Tax=Sagittula sp. NFXS13 TaxID=2819095 RepID=UPI0032DEE4A1